MRSLVVAGHVLSVFVSFHVGLPLPPTPSLRGGMGDLPNY